MIIPILGAIPDDLPQLTGGDVFTRVLAVFLLIGINAFFVTAEYAIVAVRRSRINQLVLVGDVQAKTVQGLQQSIDRLLSTTQFGITLSSIALGWIGESTMAVLIAAVIGRLPLDPAMQTSIAHAVAIPLAFVAIVYLQIVLGELCPKSLALIYAEQLARFLGPPSLAIARVFNPFIWILNRSTQLLLRLAGVPHTSQGWYTRVTPEELQLIISTASESTGLEAEERQLLSNVFTFGDVAAGEVMVPRTSLIALPKTATLQMLLDEIARSGHSRYPIMGESLDDICGVIYFKALALPLAKGQLDPNGLIEPWIRPARFVQEYLPLNELLHQMQRSGQEMVMVVDEFGGTAGLVTLKDVVAEIIGDPYEVEDAEEATVQVLDEQTFIVQAQIDIEEVNDLLSVELPIGEDYQTLAGFMIDRMQKIPLPGESLRYGDLVLTVETADGPRLDTIRVYRQDAWGADLPAELDANWSPADFTVTLGEPRDGMAPPPTRADLWDSTPNPALAELDSLELPEADPPSPPAPIAELELETSSQPEDASARQEQPHQPRDRSAPDAKNSSPDAADAEDAMTDPTLHLGEASDDHRLG